MVKTLHPYIVKNEEILKGEPIVVGTRTSVRTIVENWRMGLSPEEIGEALPHITLAQVFDALSYYMDNQEEIGEYILKNRIPKEKIHPALQKYE
jgi:uncharacterized protein (DUF433 family)